MSDSYEFCAVLAGRLSTVMLPPDATMPSREMEQVINEHLADSGGVGALVLDLEDRIAALTTERDALHAVIDEAMGHLRREFKGDEAAEEIEQCLRRVREATTDDD